MRGIPSTLAFMATLAITPCRSSGNGMAAGEGVAYVAGANELPPRSASSQGARGISPIHINGELSVTINRQYGTSRRGPVDAFVLAAIGVHLAAGGGQAPRLALPVFTSRWPPIHDEAICYGRLCPQLLAHAPLSVKGVTSTSSPSQVVAFFII